MFAAGKQLFTAGSAAPSLAIISTITGLNSLWEIGINPSGTEVYALSHTYNGEENAYVISTSSDTVIDTITGGGGRNMVFHPNGTKYYVGQGQVAKKISSVNVATKEVTFSSGVGLCEGIAIKSDLSEVFLLSQQGTFYKINSSTLGVNSSYSLPSSSLWLAFAPDGSKVYAFGAYAANSIYVLDSAGSYSNTISTSVGPWFGNVSPNGAKIYVSNYTSSSVSIVDVATETVTKTITVGSNPSPPVFSPDGRYAYFGVSTTNNHKIVAIDTTTETISAELATGAATLHPRRLAITPDGKKLYVLDTATGTKVTVISGMP